MLNPFMSSMMLAIEAQRVIEMRFIRMAWGGAEAQFEAQLMITEKVDAAIEAAGTLMTGGSMEAVVARYREHVAGNDTRLRAPRLS